MTSVVVNAASEVLDQTTAGSPRALAVVTDFAAWSAGLTSDGLIAGGDETALTRAVLVSDGDEVKVYDAHLRPQKTLGGLSAPRGVAGDTQGRFYVADTGRDRLVRFTAEGVLDPSFGTAGAVSATVDGVAFRGPTALALGHFGDWAAARPQLLMIDAGNDRLVACAGEPMACSALAPRVERDDAADAPATGLAGLAAGGDLDDILYTPPAGPFAGVVSDGLRLLAWSRTKAGARFDVVGTPGLPLRALASVPARSLLGMTLVVGADKDGALREWLVGSQHAPEARRETLPFAVTAVALDSYATAFRWNAWRRTPGSRARLESGPVVAYVAGAGRLERRLLSSVEALPW